MLTTVLVIWTAAVLTPGPNMLVVAHVAVSAGRLTAAFVAAGTVTGTAIWGCAGWLGISALFAAAPAAYLALKLAGGAYLVWLGVQLIRRRWARERPGLAEAPPLQTETIGTSAVRAFRLGLLTNLANPKSALFVAGLFAAALPASYHWTMGAATVAIMVAMTTVFYTAFVLILSDRRIAARYLAARSTLDTAIGTAFVGFGGALMLSAR